MFYIKIWKVLQRLLTSKAFLDGHISGHRSIVICNRNDIEACHLSWPDGLSAPVHVVTNSDALFDRYHVQKEQDSPLKPLVICHQQRYDDQIVVSVEVDIKFLCYATMSKDDISSSECTIESSLEESFSSDIL